RKFYVLGKKQVCAKKQKCRYVIPDRHYSRVITNLWQYLLWLLLTFYFSAYPVSVSHCCSGPPASARHLPLKAYWVVVVDSADLFYPDPACSDPYSGPACFYPCPGSYRFYSCRPLDFFCPGFYRFFYSACSAAVVVSV